MAGWILNHAQTTDSDSDYWQWQNGAVFNGRQWCIHIRCQGAYAAPVRKTHNFLYLIIELFRLVIKNKSAPWINKNDPTYPLPKIPGYATDGRNLNGHHSKNVFNFWSALTEHIILNFHRLQLLIIVMVAIIFGSRKSRMIRKERSLQGMMWSGHLCSLFILTSLLPFSTVMA